MNCNVFGGTLNLTQLQPVSNVMSADLCQQVSVR